MASEWVLTGVELLDLGGKVQPHPVHCRLPVACESWITEPGAGPGCLRVIIARITPILKPTPMAYSAMMGGVREVGVEVPRRRA